MIRKLVSPLSPLALVFWLAALCSFAPALARAGVNERYFKAARKFLEKESRVDDMIRVMHTGTTALSGTFHKGYAVTTGEGKEGKGSFAIEMRYKWRGVFTRNGETDVLFSFDKNGRLYDMEVIRTNGLPFLVTRAMLEVTKLAVKVLVRGEDNASEVGKLAESIKTVRGLQLLKLRVEQTLGR